MYELVKVDHNSWQHISPQVILKHVNAMDRTNYDSCSMAVKRMGMLGVSGRKMMKAPTVKMEAVTLISNGR
jgi:hypothetical protein